MSRDQYTMTPAERTALIREARPNSPVTVDLGTGRTNKEPWVLAVAFDSEADYGDAKDNATLFLGSISGKRLGADMRDGQLMIVLAGERAHLIGPLSYFAGGWPSARIDLRPAADLTPEG